MKTFQIWSYFRSVFFVFFSPNTGKYGPEITHDKHPNKIVLTKAITNFLSLILTLNNFIFNSVNYKQNMGCAMGTVCSPCHVNLFMAQFEEKHITYTSKIWLSYI